MALVRYCSSAIVCSSLASRGSAAVSERRSILLTRAASFRKKPGEVLSAHLVGDVLADLTQSGY
jgi:hypothetical protein